MFVSGPGELMRRGHRTFDFMKGYKNPDIPTKGYQYH